MKQHSVDPLMWVHNRRRFRAAMQHDSVAIFVSNDELISNADAYYPWKQSSDLLWLTGIDQPETIYVAVRDSDGESREMLFIKHTDAQTQLWQGDSLGLAEAIVLTGIEEVYRYEEYETIVTPLLHSHTTISLPRNEHARAKIRVPYAQGRWRDMMVAMYPGHEIISAAPLLSRLRSVKSSYEIELMQQAIAISATMFDQLLSCVKPGMREYEIEAEIIREYICHGGVGHAFEPIVASGQRACTLHYTANNQQCKDGALVLIDSGVSYAHYASDMTRVLPVNGRFTQRQKDVYNAVLRIQRTAKSFLQEGISLTDYHAQLAESFSRELVDLGLLMMQDIVSNPLAYKQYCPHGISHFIGLDVHDVGAMDEPLQAGMVATCEPGIYIPAEGLGIRLENEILITQDGCVDLMESIPIEVEEIEGRMNC